MNALAYSNFVLAFDYVHFRDVFYCAWVSADLTLLHVSVGSPLPLSGKSFTPSQLVDSLKHPTVSKLQRGSSYAFATDSTRRRSRGTKKMHVQ